MTGRSCRTVLGSALLPGACAGAASGAPSLRLHVGGTRRTALEPGATRELVP